MKGKAQRLLCPGVIPAATSDAGTRPLWRRRSSAVVPEPLPQHLSTASLPVLQPWHPPAPLALLDPLVRRLTCPTDSLQAHLPWTSFCCAFTNIPNVSLSADIKACSGGAKVKCSG